MLTPSTSAAPNRSTYPAGGNGAARAASRSARTRRRSSPRQSHALFPPPVFPSTPAGRSPARTAARNVLPVTPSRAIAPSVVTHPPTPAVGRAAARASSAGHTRQRLPDAAVPHAPGCTLPDFAQISHVRTATPAAAAACLTVSHAADSARSPLVVSGVAPMPGLSAVPPPDLSPPPARPAASAECPVAAIRRPGTAIQCPSAALRCPSAAIRCPSAAIRCPSAAIRCPSMTTECPSVWVGCPTAALRCPDGTFRRPGVRFRCPSRSLGCPVGSARRPAAAEADLAPAVATLRYRTGSDAHAASTPARRSAAPPPSTVYPARPCRRTSPRRMRNARHR